MSTAYYVEIKKNNMTVATIEPFVIKANFQLEFISKLTDKINSLIELNRRDGDWKNLTEFFTSQHIVYDGYVFLTLSKVSGDNILDQFSFVIQFKIVDIIE